MKRIDAIADALAAHHKALDPDSKAYQLRNPGLLRSYQFKTLIETDEKMVRKFSSFIGGYRALVDDIELKIKGNRRGAGSERILSGLLASYRVTSPAAIFEIADFVSRALKCDVLADTPLDFFLEG